MLVKEVTLKLIWYLADKTFKKNLILRELTIAYLNRKCNNFKAALFEEGRILRYIYTFLNICRTNSGRLSLSIPPFSDVCICFYSLTKNRDFITPQNHCAMC